MTSILLDEIHEQPDVMARLLREQAMPIARLANAMRSGDIDRVLIAARGTSDNAARFAQYLFGAHRGSWLRARGAGSGAGPGAGQSLRRAWARL